MIRILYLGSDSAHSTSLHRANALRRIGHQVQIFDPAAAIGQSVKTKLSGIFHYRTGYYFLQDQILTWLNTVVEQQMITDLVWVDSGELLGYECIALLKEKLKCPVILYNIDDPTGKRDGGRFKTLIRALPIYDLVNVVRNETKEECIRLGAKMVRRVWRSYDELKHRPFEAPDAIPPKYRTEVCFVGTWIRYEKRDKFLIELAKSGLAINIWGNRWKKSSYWSFLKAHYNGGELGGPDYVAAIQGAKINIGLLSKGNRDLHTTRSLEIPYAGGLLCAKRTSEHLELYKDGVEAVFWDDAKECAHLCKELLQDDVRREAIRIAGMKRVRELGVGNEDICRGIIQAAGFTDTIR